MNDVMVWRYRNRDGKCAPNAKIIIAQANGINMIRGRSILFLKNSVQMIHERPECGIHEMINRIKM